jgi:hypothetical protein
MLQHGGANAIFANLIAGLVTAAVGAVALVSPHPSHRTETGQEQAMGLNRHQEHELRVIEAGLFRSDPHLGGMFGVFGRLYPDQDVPAGEQVPASQERSRLAHWIEAVLTAMAGASRRGRVRTSAAKPERTRDGGETGDQHDHSGPVS